jgi:hypothetical protein
VSCCSNRIVYFGGRERGCLGFASCKYSTGLFRIVFF